ncbi:hypothetical protein DMUE_5650 [Dictyocoela muelleri]|nr:hypothetical protein DMUE_5650 [Dictyocoela muelleri]
MPIKIISNSKRIIIIGAMAIFILLIFLIGFRMYGSSVISEVNEQQIEIIKGALSSKKKDYLDQIFKIFSDHNVNCFLFKHTDDTIDEVSKKFENVEDLRKMKIGDEIKLNNGYFTLGFREKYFQLQLNYNKFAANELVEENSWSGLFYKMTGGYSLPDTLLEILNHMQSLKSKLDKGKVGAAFLGENIHIFFYNNGESKVEDIYDIHGMDDKLTALDIFRYFLIVKVENVR